MKTAGLEIESSIKGELFSVERLEEFAAFLAGELKITDNPRLSQPLLPRMRKNGESLLMSYRALTQAIHRKEAIPPAAEWLTDNFHIVEEQLREIQEDLPPSYYKELPKIALGDLTGYPRVYAIALALVAHTDSELDPEKIRRFIQAFQVITPLNIGELWAVPITLRLVLVENLRRLTVSIVTDHEKRNLANRTADEIFDATPDKKKVQSLAEKIPLAVSPSAEHDCSYFAQLAKRLRDQEPEIWPALEFLEKHLIHRKSSAEQVVHLSHQKQASNQVSVANIITSMRLLSSLNWRDFFESLSLVDRVLEKDPIYSQMDFLTRDRYRHVIEKIGKKTKNSEIEIAKTVVKMTEEAQKNSHVIDQKRTHVGYYLIDRGAAKLREIFSYKSFTLLKLISSNRNLTYFGLLLFFTLAICAFPLKYSEIGGASLWQLIGIFFLILVPCSDLALSLTNLILTHIILPKNLPKLDLSSGVPPEARTMVVIPCLLSSTGVILELIEKLEIHFLGNQDQELYFALLTDFTDAESENTNFDEKRLQTLQVGLAKLNQKYFHIWGNRFFYFHRKRLWNDSENTWMGWERKRGKIQEFNQLLRGHAETSFSQISAPEDLLPTFRYVITLDADTQLPRDSAQKMIGTLLHPLNQAVFNKKLGRVTEGYSILQPRVGISLESSTKSYFAKIFSGYIGIDPYTTAVSEVYQDLFHEGSYTGKGIYDIDAFEASLENRVPENTILSHDLFEGLYARTALLTDIELLDDYPQSYKTFFTRQHRWTRGDWQIGAWILPYVRNAKGQLVKNQLPLISRWKIADNLRRSLVAPTSLLWFILAWTCLPGSATYWIAYALGLIIFPSLVQSLLGAVVLRLGDHSSRLSDQGVKTKINILQFLFFVTFLAHQAVIQTDAIIRVYYRKYISKKKLLEWSTAAQVESQNEKTNAILWQSFWPTEILLISLGILFAFIQIAEPFSALFFFILWMSYPLAAHIVSYRLVQKLKEIKASDRLLLRQIARRTWHYFETFVGPEDQWLPPDNYQEYPHPVTAHRTSPTNIGLYLLSLMSARDFGYISTWKMLAQLKLTFATMQKMETHQGHFLNWYDTTTLAPLHPKYVSTVDSGNLAGYLVTIRQACLDISKSAVVDTKILHGIEDSLLVIEKESANVNRELENCRNLLTLENELNFSQWLQKLEIIEASVRELHEKLQTKKLSQLCVWTEACFSQIEDAKNHIKLFAPWVSLQNTQELKEVIDFFGPNFSLQKHLQSYDQAFKRLSELQQSKTIVEFTEALTASQTKVSEIRFQAQAACLYLEKTFTEMNFEYLLEKDREVFSIGFNVSDGKFDRGLYDLLGSESRLASFIAIAKGDVKQEHWFRLGRQLVPTDGDRALVSWTASMFEYLMPLLVLRNYENTLLHETNQAVVKRQIKYGLQNHVPWGISEAGYNARDLQLNYQYGPFGIPGLGLKRGLSHDLVISPYSTLLAAMVNPVAAVENIKRLILEKLLTNYGFYEAVDYTRERLPENESFAIIKSFMAHHQGMSLVALNNVIHNNVVQNRFHKDPRMRATRLLLQERIPEGVRTLPPKAAEIELETKEQPDTHTLVRHYTNPNSSSPRIQLLSNRNYSIMISTAGGGYSKCNDLTMTRWKEDATRDPYGSFIFIKNHTENKLWSTTYQPFAVIPESYKVTFGEEKVEFHRRDGEISSYTQILVAPEDNVEIRHVTLTNHSDEPQSLELTSYLEPVLSPLNNDLDHLAFSKLFIQTEFLPSKNALLARRRKRSQSDIENWGLHVVVADTAILSEVQYETDRDRFIGRGRSLSDAQAFDEGSNLTNTIGATIDPVMALRIQVVVAANAQIQVAFATGITNSREKALELSDRYHDIHAFDRESKLAWTQSQVDMRHLNMDSQSSQLYQRIAERILYSEPTLRPPSHHREANTNQQSSLWPSGIGGDLPIVVVRINDQKDVPVIRKLLRCHEYLRLKGLIYDFVIINEFAATYHQDLQEEIMHQVRATGSQGMLNKNGGLFILRCDITPAKDIAHIHAVARISLSAGEPLNEQVNRKSLDEKYPALANFPAAPKKDKLITPAKMNLEFFNGYGGFSEDGKEYIVQLQAGQWTPAPWINVIGNARGFGFQISESGSGFTWNMNSQSNRLTPWSNDPVSDTPGEIIYLRDDETGEIWTPTPLPIRSQAPYIIRHGQGYSVFEHSNHGLEHQLKVFVPKDESVKISLLKLKNSSNRKRRLSIISYTEWVLGTRREKTSPFLICDIDQASGAIFAKNPHDNEFASTVSFADISQTNRTFTCSRKEFLGRNGSYADPAALKRVGLSKKKGTGQDPCAVFQTSVELKVGEEFEMSFLLGQCDNADAARALSLRFRDINQVKTALNEVIAYWQSLIQTIQVKTPEPSMNVIMNNWLFYQTLSCRYWSRTAFYQSGGAYGFRDQLQDCMAFVYAAPDIAKEQILRAAAHQFKEGDVQHWWHPPTGRGIRTRMTDDLLWLPYVVSFYIQVTGDKSILEEEITFLDQPLLMPEQEDSYSLPAVTSEKASLFEHCTRAIQFSLKLGQHGLPLIGTGDWNDGMNRVGMHGTGESVWLGWFFYKVLADFLPHCQGVEQTANKEIYQQHMQKLKGALEKDGWDKEWYKRAYFDDGTPIGSVEGEECKIDSISQTWSVLSKAGDPTRAAQAMGKVSELLVRRDSKLVLLLTPPFDKMPKDPGYIKGYVPGVRENGGQYTHAAIWVMMAFAELGDGNQAQEIFNFLNPVLHAKSKSEADQYKVEPYVMAGDVYAGAHEGRGGWSWYTGSSSWYYRGGLESILGFQLRAGRLKIKPCIPKSWKTYEIQYKFGSSTYVIVVKNPSGLSTGLTAIEVDRHVIRGSDFELIDDGKIHQVVVTLLNDHKQIGLNDIVET